MSKMRTSYKEQLSSLLSRDGKPSFVFDIDGTLKHPDNKKYLDKFNPMLSVLMARLQQLGAVGSATDQSAAELHRFSGKLAKSHPLHEEPFSGPYVLEGGT